TLSQSCNRGGSYRSGFGPNNLRVAILRQGPGFIFAVARIHEEIEAAIRVLEFGQEISFPLGFLHDIADAVAAFGESKVIKGGNTRQRVDGEHEIMDEAGAIRCVFAVITGIVMASGNVNRALASEREKLRRRTGQRWSRLSQA